MGGQQKSIAPVQELALIRRHARHLVFAGGILCVLLGAVRASGDERFLQILARMETGFPGYGIMTLTAGGLLLGGLHFWILASRAIQRIESMAASEEKNRNR